MLSRCRTTANPSDDFASLKACDTGGLWLTPAELAAKLELGWDKERVLSALKSQRGLLCSNPALSAGLGIWTYSLSQGLKVYCINSYHEDACSKPGKVKRVRGGEGQACNHHQNYESRDWRPHVPNIDDRKAPPARSRPPTPGPPKTPVAAAAASGRGSSRRSVGALKSRLSGAMEGVWQSKRGCAEQALQESEHTASRISDLERRLAGANLELSKQAETTANIERSKERLRKDKDANIKSLTGRLEALSPFEREVIELRASNIRLRGELQAAQSQISEAPEPIVTRDHRRAFNEPMRLAALEMMVSGTAPSAVNTALPSSGAFYKANSSHCEAPEDGRSSPGFVHQGASTDAAGRPMAGSLSL